jgi:hypothetical protein
VIYRAAAALPHEDRIRALDGLRGQLRIMAVATGATPDWTTLRVAGPTEVAGVQDRMRFEWRASVVVHGVATSLRLPEPALCLSRNTDACLTSPFPVLG